MPNQFHMISTKQLNEQYTDLLDQLIKGLSSETMNIIYELIELEHELTLREGE